MKQNNESPINQITKEFADSGTLFYLEAKYLSLVTKAIHNSNYSKALPDRMGCRGKAGKIAVELVYRFLNKHGLILTNNSFNSEYAYKLTNRDNGSSLINIVKLKDESNPLHELVQVMKKTERHQYHHPKLVQALMNKVPHLLNDEAKSHFNSILSRATIAKNNRDKNFSPSNCISQDNNYNPNTPTAVPQSNQINTIIKQPIVFLDEGTDNDSQGKPQNLLLTLNLNIKSPTNPDEQATLELSPPLPNPSQITATAVLLPEGDEYQKISSSNGTNQIYNEEEECIRERTPQITQNREIQGLNQAEKEYEYSYEYEEVEDIQNTPPKINKKENIKNDTLESENKVKPQKSPKSLKQKRKPKKKSSIDPQIQQQLEQQQLIIQKLQELNQFQQQQQQEQQQKFQQQLQQQELQQQQLQHLLQEQQIQQNQIQQQLQQKSFKSPSDTNEENYSQTYSPASSTDGDQEKSDSSYTNNSILSEGNKLDQYHGGSEATMTSVADLIDDQTDVKKRGIQSVSNALNNLLKNKKQVIAADDESSISIPLERKEKPQLCIESFSMPEVPFNDNCEYSDLPSANQREGLSGYSEYSNYSNYTNYTNANEESNYSNYTDNNQNLDSNNADIQEEESVNENSDLLNAKTREANFERPNNINSNENDEAKSSQVTSVAEKEYPDEVLRSIKNAFSPKKGENNSFATTKDDYYYSPYYSSEYYTYEDDDGEDDLRKRKNDNQKQVKFKLRINKEQFERFYPNQNLSNAQTIKVTKRGLSQLQEIMSQKKNNEPLRQVIRLKTPTLPSSPSPFQQPQQSKQPFQSTPHQKTHTDPSTISVVTKGPHAGLIKRKIKKSDRQADLQKKLEEKTEYAKKLQERLQTMQREMEEQAANPNTTNIDNIQMTNKKLAKSQPQTKTNKRVRDRSISPNEIDRPNSAPKKRGKNTSNYKKRSIPISNDFDSINTSSLIPPSLSTVSEVHPELMSPKQREQKKKEIKGRIKKLQDELNQRSDPEEKRLKRAKIEAKLQQLREEFERSSDTPVKETKRRKIESNQKKSNNLGQNGNFSKAPRNNDIDNMTPAQRRKRRNEIRLEIQKLRDEFNKNSDIESQSVSYDNNENSRPLIPRRNNQRDIGDVPISQSRPQEREIDYHQGEINDQSGYYTSYNSNSNIETEESYTQSSIQQVKPDFDDVHHSHSNSHHHSKPEDPIKQAPPLQQRLQPPRNREIINNINDINDDDNINESSSNLKFSRESSSLSERRKYKKMKVDIPVKEDTFKRFNEQEDRRKEDERIDQLDLESNNYDDDRDSVSVSVSVNSDMTNQPEYKPPKINIKKTPKRKGSNNNSQIEEANKTDEKRIKKSQLDSRYEIVDEKVVTRDGKKKIKRRIHIPISQSQEKQSNPNDNYNYNEYEYDENYGSKKVTAKSSSNVNKQIDTSLKNDLNEEKLDDDLANTKNTDKNLNDQDDNTNFLLYVNVIEAKDVPNVDSFDPCDPYCLLSIEGQGEESSRKTKSMEKTSNPVWNENFEFIVNNEKQRRRRKKNLSSSSLNSQFYILNVQLKDEDKIAGDVLLSSTKIDLLNFQFDKEYDLWFSLQNDANSDDAYNMKSKNKENPDSQKGSGKSVGVAGSNPIRSGGRIHLILKKVELLDENDNDIDENGNKSYSASNSIKKLNESKLFDSKNSQKIKLNILIDQAEGLSRRNQYIVAKIKNSPEGVMKTMPINSSEPIWNERFKLKLPNPQTDVLIVTLRAKDEKNGDDDIGNISIPISSLTVPNSGNIVDKWFEFRSTSYANKNKNYRGRLSTQTMCGKIHLLLSTEIDKDETSSNYGSNSVTPNASSSNSAYRGSSSVQKNNPNPVLMVKQQVPNSAHRHLAVQIVEARGLPSHCYPFCVIQIRDEKPIFHTRAVQPIPIPKWNQKLDFHSRKAVEDGILDISIKDKRSNKEPEIASLSISVEALNQAKRAASKNEDEDEDEEFVINKWFPLEPSGSIHLILVPRMKDSPKPTILTPIDDKDNYDDIDINDNSLSNDDGPGIQIDASSSDIDINIEFDESKEKAANARKITKRHRRTNHEIDSHKKRILDQFPPTTSEEE